MRSVRLGHSLLDRCQGFVQRVLSATPALQLSANLDRTEEDGDDGNDEPGKRFQAEQRHYQELPCHYVLHDAFRD